MFMSQTCRRMTNFKSEKINCYIMDKDGDLFKIKPIGGKNIVSEDRRKLISPFNSAKHFKAANLPALCDQCVL